MARSNRLRLRFARARGARSADPRAANPLAAKSGHHTAKAKRVIFLFMQGGVSHVDSFDYKPALDKDDGKQITFDDARVIANTGMRGSHAARHEAAVEVRPARPVRPLGVGPVPRDEQARRRPVLHPLDAHRRRRPRPGDAVPALRLDELRPPDDGLVGAVRPRHREREPAGLRVASRRRRATAGRATTATRSSRRSTRARRSARPADPRPTRPSATSSGALSTGATQEHFDLLRELNAEQLKADAGRRGAGGGRRRRTNSPGGCRRTPRTCSTCRRRSPETLKLYGIGDEGDRQLRPAVPDGPPAVRGGRAVRPGDLRRQHRQPRVGPALEPAQARRPREGRRQADRRAARRPEAARAARRHARVVGRRVRPHALRARRTAPAATTTPAASRSGWPAAASSRASRSARPTSSATRRCRTRSTCTTCTRRSCTCSASTTRS